MEKEDKYFYLEKIFPNSNEILSSSYKSLDDIKNHCIYILDTNILLFPYKTSTQSLNEFKKIYTNLIADKRLIIPARVIREFANNRGKNLAEIYKKLKQKENSLDRIDTKNDYFPILEKEEGYIQLQKIEDQLKELLKKSRETLRALQSKVSNYNWNDPISELYKELFTPAIIKEVSKSKAGLIEDLNFRIEHKIAPGYKDESKSDKGIGDLIIWQTILEIGKELNNDLIFVTDDSKNDWFYIEEKKTIYPKFELFDEFRRFSQNTIHIVDVTTFMEIQNAPPQTIKEVKENKDSPLMNSPKSVWSKISHLAVQVGMVVNYNSLGDGRLYKINTGTVIAVEPHEEFENVITVQNHHRVNDIARVAGKNFIWRANLATI